ncbi:PQQ-dependent sugar dehydrogenase [Terrabacter sp. MAHUQ-38]|uniref:PQQ-dependent sugar dehydrogenase n=1 Tax=unclassified Terrabacter TaxID=2630222 RepID=UPI00165D3208|nr:PQQ-dependent sugar dehydrogenase [Terrabacter sp. MAHUQ-38]MBC9822204.1 PQQ-dependent sugar dehydrogenase [Terrabacter sp. MAHUQ-38]
MVRRLRVRGSIALAGTLLAGAALVAPHPPAAEAAPTLQVTTVVSGLSYPWDITWVGDLMLYDLRGGQVWSKRGGNAPRRVSISGFPAIYVNSEGGLLGLVADPAASTNKRFYTCQSVRSSSGGALDVRVLRWRLTSDTSAVSDGAPVVTGLPITTGRHSGCRLRFGTDGKLYVGTGDAAVGTNPQNLGSLGGKVLRVGWNGTIPTDNPFYSRGGNARYVWQYGHRNIQGLALRPGTSELWTAEHGTSRDDEVNLSLRGANYGWDPVPGYDESTPMTDLSKFPSARVAMWSSGYPTVATSGTTFLRGSAWGEWQGALAVGLLKGEGIYLMRFNPSPTTTRVASVTRLAAAQGYGRIRAVQLGPDGSLYFTTSNGSNDKIVRIRPTASVPSRSGGSLISPVGVTAARTGTQVVTFARGTGDAVSFRRSTNDGSSWGAWTSAGVTSTDAPSATSSRPGRVDLFTRNASRQLVHTWFQDGIRKGSANLGGTVIAQHGASLGNGTIDVFAVASTGSAWRKHFNGTSWSGWVSAGGVFTSGLSASAKAANGTILVTGRGTNGATYERVFTPSGASTGWVRRYDNLAAWSDRALGDTWPGRALVAVGNGVDRHAVLQRGSTLTGLAPVFTSAPDVVTRADGTFLLFGRGADGHLWVYSGRPGAYTSTSLGGTVR